MSTRRTPIEHDGRTIPDGAHAIREHIPRFTFSQCVGADYLRDQSRSFVPNLTRPHTARADEYPALRTLRHGQAKSHWSLLLHQTRLSDERQSLTTTGLPARVRTIMPIPVRTPGCSQRLDPLLFSFDAPL